MNNTNKEPHILYGDSGQVIVNEHLRPKIVERNKVMTARGIYATHAQFNKWLTALTEVETDEVIEMMDEYKQQSSVQAGMSLTECKDKAIRKYGFVDSYDQFIKMADKDFHGELSQYNDWDFHLRIIQEAAELYAQSTVVKAVEEKDKQIEKWKDARIATHELRENEFVSFHKERLALKENIRELDEALEEKEKELESYKIMHNSITIEGNRLRSELKEELKREKEENHNAQIMFDDAMIARDEQIKIINSQSLNIEQLQAELSKKPRYIGDNEIEIELFDEIGNTLGIDLKLGSYMAKWMRSKTWEGKQKEETFISIGWLFEGFRYDSIEELSGRTMYHGNEPKEIFIKTNFDLPKAPHK